MKITIDMTAVVELEDGTVSAFDIADADALANWQRLQKRQHVVNVNVDAFERAGGTK